MEMTKVIPFFPILSKDFQNRELIMVFKMIMHQFFK